MNQEQWRAVLELRARTPWKLPRQYRKSSENKRLLMRACHPNRLKIYRKRFTKSLNTIFEEWEPDWIFITREKKWKAASVLAIPAGFADVGPAKQKQPKCL